MTATNTYLPNGVPVPVPSPDGLDTEYWAATRRHELVVQRCDDCQTFVWGPEWVCQACQSSRLTWTKVDGRGRIYSWVRPWHPIHPALASAVPYLVVLVDLAGVDGVRMIGNLLGDPMQDVEIGTEVRAVFEDHPDHDITLVQWEVVP
jgi:uncharacterized OB-fold protein